MIATDWISTIRVILHFALAIFVIIGAKYDLRDRIIPRFSGFPALILGLLSLLIEGKLLYALQFVLIVFSGSGLKYMPVPLVAAILLLSQNGNSAIPFIVSILVSFFFYSMHFLGGR